MPSYLTYRVYQLNNTISTISDYVIHVIYDE